MFFGSTSHLSVKCKCTLDLLQISKLVFDVVQRQPMLYEDRESLICAFSLRRDQLMINVINIAEYDAGYNRSTCANERRRDQDNSTQQTRTKYRDKRENI